jgi:hypothetical protein
MPKSHRTEQDLDLHCSSTQVRLHPTWRCPCGHILRGYDVEIINSGRIQIICTRCHTKLLEIAQT